MLPEKNRVTAQEYDPCKWIEDMNPGEFGQVVYSPNERNIGLVVFRPYISQWNGEFMKVVELSTGDTLGGTNLKVRILSDIRITRLHQ